MTNTIGPLGPKMTYDASLKSTEETDNTTAQSPLSQASSQAAEQTKQTQPFTQQALQQLRDMPTVDPQKVAAAKAKIAAGQLGILQSGEAKAQSADNIAAALLDLDALLPKGE